MTTRVPLISREVQTSHDVVTQRSVPVESLPADRCEEHVLGAYGRPHAWRKGLVTFYCEPEQMPAEERLLRYESRADVIVRQTDYWIDKDRRKLPLTHMSCRYKRNVRIIRRAPFYLRAHMWSPLTLGAPDDVQDMAAREMAELDFRLQTPTYSPEQWVIETPLCRELLYQSRARDFDGPIQ